MHCEVTAKSSSGRQNVVSIVLFVGALDGNKKPYTDTLISRVQVGWCF